MLGLLLSRVASTAEVPIAEFLEAGYATEDVSRLDRWTEPIAEMQEAVAQQDW